MYYKRSFEIMLTMRKLFEIQIKSNFERKSSTKQVPHSNYLFDHFEFITGFSTKILE